MANTPLSLTVVRSLAAILLCILSIKLALLSMTAASANTDYYRSQNTLSTRSGELPNSSQVSRAHRYILRALEKMPVDANTLDLAGRVDYFRAAHESAPQTKLALLNSSQQHHLAALAERPFWPYSEVNILYAKSAAGEIDSLFADRFSLTIQRGSNDPAVIKDLTLLGISNWDQLGEKNKLETVRLTELTLKQNLISVPVLRSYLQDDRNFYSVCARLKQFEEKQKLCNS